MSRTNWKNVERSAASLFGLTRFPANMGGRLDFGPRHPKHAPFVGQVKNPKRQPLNVLTKLAEEMDEIAAKERKSYSASDLDDREHFGVVVVKLSNKRPTPKLVVFTEDTWLRIRAMLPFDWESGLPKREEHDGQEDKPESEQAS